MERAKQGVSMSDAKDKGKDRDKSALNETPTVFEHDLI